MPPQHVARVVVDIVSQLDLSRIYGKYMPIGGEAIAPEILLVAQAAVLGGGHADWSALLSFPPCIHCLR